MYLKLGTFDLLLVKIWLLYCGVTGVNVDTISSMHNRSVATVMKRPKGNREKAPIPCPTAIVDDTQLMGEWIWPINIFRITH